MNAGEAFWIGAAVGIAVTGGWTIIGMIRGWW